MNYILTFLITISGAIIGGCIAGRFALRATEQAHENQKVVAKENEEIIIRSLMQAIHDELEAVFERYNETMGSRVESLGKGEPLIFYYPLMSDFFSVYHGNTILIGRIKDHDLRKSIIHTYTLAKGLIDSFRFNNELIQKWDHWSMIYLETQQPIHKIQSDAHLKTLISYAENIKITHEQLKKSLKDTTRMLVKKGVLS